MKYYDTSTISLQQLKGKGGRKGGFTQRSLVRRLVPWLQKERKKTIKLRNGWNNNDVPSQQKEKVDKRLEKGVYTSGSCRNNNL